MTEYEFNQLVPCKSLVTTFIDGKQKIMLLKFFICDNGDYSLCLTEDLSNPYPSEIVEGDIETYFNLCEFYGTVGNESKNFLKNYE